MAVLAHHLLELVDALPPKLRVVESALKWVPRLDPSKREPGGVETSTARTREHRPDRDAVLPKRLADQPGLTSAAVVEIALGGTVIEPGVGRIEATRGEAGTRR